MTSSKQDRVSLQIVWNVVLELNIKCCQQEILLSKKDDDIRDLQQKLTKQKELHRREIAELRVQMQQEAYMAQMMSKGQASQSDRLKHSKQK